MNLDNYIKEVIQVEVKEYLDKHFKDYISDFTTEKEFYTRKQAADKLAITEYAVKQKESKELDVVYLNQNAPRITRESIDKHIIELKEQAVRYKLN
jgi:hypothetical protein